MLPVSDGRESLDRVRIPFYEIDQQGGLRVRLGAPLLPVLQSANVGPKVDGKQCARDIQVFAHANQFFRRNLRHRLVLDGMRTQCAFALPCIGKCRHALAQFSDKVTFGSARFFGFDSSLHLVNHFQTATFALATPGVGKPQLAEPAGVRYRVAGLGMLHLEILKLPEGVIVQIVGPVALISGQLNATQLTKGSAEPSLQAE